MISNLNWKMMVMGIVAVSQVGAASANPCAGQPAKGTTVITRVVEIEQRTNDVGADYVIIRGPGVLPSGATTNAISLIFLSDASGTCSFCTVDQKRRSRNSQICLDSARQAMATGKGFFVAETEGAKANLSTTADTGFYGPNGSCSSAVMSTTGTFMPPQRCGIR